MRIGITWNHTDGEKDVAADRQKQMQMNLLFLLFLPHKVLIPVIVDIK